MVSTFRRRARERGDGNYALASHILYAPGVGMHTDTHTDTPHVVEAFPWCVCISHARVRLFNDKTKRQCILIGVFLPLCPDSRYAYWERTWLGTQPVRAHSHVRLGSLSPTLAVCVDTGAAARPHGFPPVHCARVQPCPGEVHRRCVMIAHVYADCVNCFAPTPSSKVLRVVCSVPSSSSALACHSVTPMNQTFS